MALVETAARGPVTAVLTAIAGWLHDERCKRRLKRVLQDRRNRFGTIAHLSATSGASPEKTRRLLVAIGARPSETDFDIWTLRPPRVR